MDLQFFIVLELVTNLILLVSTSKPESLEDCLLDFVKKYQGRNVLCMAKSESFLLKLEQPRWLYYKIWSKWFKQPLDQIDAVVLLPNFDDDLASISQFYFKSNVLLLIVNSERTRDAPQKLLFLAWRYKFRNAFVIQEHDLKVYGYSPITKGYCKDVESTDLGDCFNVDYQMSIVDMSNCTIRIGALEKEPYFGGSNGGYEAAILKIITDKLRLRIEYTISSFDVIAPMLTFQKLDLLAGGMFPADGTIDIVVYYCEHEMALFVPTAKALPSWRNLLQIYDLATWVCLFASIAAFTIVAHCNHYPSIFYIICSLISSLPHQLTTLRPLFALWMFFTLILTNAFSGLLISFMFKPISERQVSSVGDLISQNWMIYDSTLYPYFINETNIKILGDRHSFCFDDELQCFFNLFLDKVAYANTIRKFNYITKLHGNIDVHKFNSLKLFSVFWMSSRSMYQNKIQEVASRMFEVGLIQHLDTFNYNPPKTIWHHHYKPVILQHLYLIFGIYIVGLFAATLAFLQEQWSPTFGPG